MMERALSTESCKKMEEKLAREAPKILDYADDLCSRIRTESGQLRYIRGLLTMALMTSDRFYGYLCAGVVLSALDRGMDLGRIEELDFKPPEFVNAGSISITEASKRVAIERIKGKKIGLLHGYYRMLTPGSLLNLVLAREECGTLFLGVERNWRAERLKQVEPVYPNRLRENIMILFPGLADYVVTINRLASSSDSYRRMVRGISPDVYFGNRGNPKWLREEMAYRAALVGAEYRELDSIPSLSTTEYLDLGGKTKLNFSLLQKK